MSALVKPPSVRLMFLIVGLAALVLALVTPVMMRTSIWAHHESTVCQSQLVSASGDLHPVARGHPGVVGVGPRAGDC